MWSDNQSTEDLLGLQYLAGAVVSIVKNENLLPATIGVFGDWGGGKSRNSQNAAHTEEEKKAGTVVLSFNGGLYEGYEGAKTALMGTILEELHEHETFKNKASGKAKKLLKSLFRRVGAFRCSGVLGCASCDSELTRTRSGVRVPTGLPFQASPFSTYASNRTGPSEISLTPLWTSDFQRSERHSREEANRAVAYLPLEHKKSSLDGQIHSFPLYGHTTSY